MKRSAWAVGLAIGAAFAPACGSGSSAATSAASTADSTTTSTSSPTTGSGGAGGADGGAAGAGGTSPNELCVQTGHSGECEMCCASDEAEGYNTYVLALIQDCACTMGSTCFAQCSDAGDLCSDPSAMTGSTACLDCVNTIGAMDPCLTATTDSVNAACAADPGCAALVVCDMGCTPLPT